jgi:hypothetical protein
MKATGAIFPRAKNCTLPEYIESMICTFLNATTIDGYNPYRITLQGIDWEIPEPHNPWANIGYWSDHQIIYLQKLMEISTKVHPCKLQSLLSADLQFRQCSVPDQTVQQSAGESFQYDRLQLGFASGHRSTCSGIRHGRQAGPGLERRSPACHAGRKDTHPAACQTGELRP